jgi:GT2 family glycosyltransferase
MAKNSSAWVIVPNWNGLNMLPGCLESLKSQTVTPHIVMVDNGSTDESVSYIETNFPSVKVIKLDSNSGFTGGVNRGIEYALEQQAEYILLFNNDAVADRAWVEHLVDSAATSPEAGIITGKLMRSDKVHLDSTGEHYSIWGLPYPRGRNSPDNNQYKPGEIFGATGGASLYRAELFKDIGLFDEDFFAYYEDVDMSMRAQMAGWKVRYQPEAIAYHDIGGTSSKLGDFARFHSAKNFLLLYARNMPTKLYFKYLPLFTLQFLRMALGSIARRKFMAFLNGTWAAIRLHRKTMEIRKNNLSKQKVGNAYIDNLLTHSRPPRFPALSKQN